MTLPRALGVISVVAIGAACVSTGAAAPGQVGASAQFQATPEATIARVRPGTISVRLQPDPTSPVMTNIRRYSLRSGEPVGFLVTGSATAVDGVVWHQVLLPARPNGVTGWVPAPLVTLEAAANRITVSLSARTVTLWRGGRPRLTSKVVIGKPNTPTPTGVFAVWDNIHLNSGIYKPAVLTLTGHSEVLTSFDGAEPRLALHGMNGGLATTPGTARSNGCIRVPTRAMRALAAFAVTGTPVEIVA